MEFRKKKVNPSKKLIHKKILKKIENYVAFQRSGPKNEVKAMDTSYWSASWVVSFVVGSLWIFLRSLWIVVGSCGIVVNRYRSLWDRCESL